VIRNVVLVKLKAGADAAEVAHIQDGLRNLGCSGTVSFTLGDDLGLRDGTWSFAIVADFNGAISSILPGRGCRVHRRPAGPRRD
jgi:hypothetical protein